MSIFKACDIRGVYGEELTEEHARALGRALALHASPLTLLVGGDGRLSTPALKAALIAALVEGGARVLDIGTVPTPAFYFARRHLGVQTGVMVTASHNPPHDNGFKIVLGDWPLTEAEMGVIRERMEADGECGGRARVGLRQVSIGAGAGEVLSIPVLEEYAAFLRSLFPARIGLRVVVDSGNGVMGLVAPQLLREVGCEVVELFSEVDGRFPNRPPNPAVAENLSALRAAVRETGAALGAAFDGDGDRAAFVDERGEVLENDRAIVLFARDALARRPGAPIVYDQKCSDAVREEILRAGGVPQVEKSGYAFIRAAMLRLGAVYAGELSGHHFFAETGGDDALYAALRMATIVQASDRPLSVLAASVPRYAITPDIRLRVTPQEAKAIFAGLKANLRGAVEIDERDGIRARFADGWGLARASVTEPVITLRFEGRTPEALDRIRRAFEQAAPWLEGKLE